MISLPGYEALLANLEGVLQQGLTKEMLLYNLNHQTPANFKDALYSIFCAKKHEIALNTEQVEIKHDITDVHQKRLDNMLMAEGITAVGVHSVYSLDAQAQACHQITNQVILVLQEQSLFRPISQLDYSVVIQTLNKKFGAIRNQLKLITCQRALTIRSRLMENKRRRRNFPKETTKILNEYFFANYTQQYPTEEIKAVLAKRCNMTIAQVSNWFGNKRIRHNKYKHTAKGRKEMEMYTGRQLPSTEISHSKCNRMLQQ